MSNYGDGYRLKCPSCGARYWYSSDKIDEYGSVECQNCAGRIFIDSMRPDAGYPFSADDAIMPSRETHQSSVEGIKIKCPNCQARYIYKQEQIHEDNTVECQNCGKVISAVGEDVLIYGGRESEPEGSETWVLLCLVLIIFLFVPLIIAIPAILCIVCLRSLSQSKSDDGPRKVIKKDSQGPSLR